MCKIEDRWNRQIIAVAIMKDGVVYTLPRPARHHDVIKYMTSVGVKAHNGEQGFIDDTGKFLRRKPAARLALKNGQAKRLDSPPRLFSEDLW